MMFKREKENLYAEQHDIITIERMLYNPDHNIIERLLQELSDETYKIFVRKIRRRNFFSRSKIIDCDSLLINMMYNIGIWLKDNCILHNGNYSYLNYQKENKSNFSDDVIVKIKVGKSKKITALKEEIINYMRTYKTTTCVLVKITPHTLYKYNRTNSLSDILLYFHYDTKKNALYRVNGIKKKKILYSSI